MGFEELLDVFPQSSSFVFGGYYFRLFFCGASAGR
jgi:hypothetical protein